MIKNITLGQYFPGESPIHRMDPRVKLLLVIALIVVVFLVQTVIGYVAVTLYLASAILLSRIPFKFVLSGLKPLRFIFIFMFLLNVFFISGETVLIDWWIFHVYLEGVITAIRLAVRLLLIITATTVMTLTTSPMEITDALERLLSPLKVIRFPASEIALMMSIALRFIPTLVEETDRIMKAQTARGASFDTGGIIARAKGMVPILVPLFVSAFKRAEELALAMEARCYNGGKGRTRYKVLRMHLRDIWASLLMAGLIALACLGY